MRPIDVRFKRRELRTLIWQIEEEATGPLTHQDTAEIIIQLKGWDIHDNALVYRVTHNVRGCKSWNNRRKRLVW